jgi:hypothetical protein
MKEAPAKTFANILEDLCAIPSAFIACLEWQRIPNAKMARDLRAMQRHHFNRKIAFVNYLSPGTKPEEMLVDNSAAATVQEIGQALTEMEVHGHFFGACSLSVVTFDRNADRLEKSVAECIKVFAGHDGALYEESYNLLNAYLAIVPGNASHNPRRLPLLNTNEPASRMTSGARRSGILNATAFPGRSRWPWWGRRPRRSTVGTRSWTTP